MNELAHQAVQILRGRTVATAESCTGGMIGAALTGVSGSSQVYCGGIISYQNHVKQDVLGVDPVLLQEKGAVCGEVACRMAAGVRKVLQADMAVSATGIAGPGSDEFDHPVGLVFLGYCDDQKCFSREYHFAGDRESVRQQAVEQALQLLIEQNR